MIRVDGTPFISRVMKREPLDLYDDRPKAMKAYLRNYGWHFNKKACDFAVSKMRKGGAKIDAWTKEQVEELLGRYGMKVNATGYDHIYVANICKAYFFKSSVPDEQHVAMHIKDVFADDDDADGNVMRTWYAKMVGKGEPVEWEDLI